MSKFIVVVFPDEAKAYEGHRVLKELHEEQCLTLYATAVAAKDEQGRVSVLQTADQGPLGTAVSALAGALSGVLGGPVVAGLGLATGAMFGSWMDLYNLGVSTGFLEDIWQELMPGKVALVAEVEETWSTPLDTRMDALGGVVVRTERVAVEEQTALREAAAWKAELMQLRVEYTQAQEAARAKLKARIEAAQARLEAAVERAETQLDEQQRHAEAQVRALQQQAATASAAAQARIEEDLAKLRADHDRRKALLQQAAALAKEALVA